MPLANETPARVALPAPEPDPLETLAGELDGIRDAVLADLGQRDRAYITGVIVAHRRIELAGRVLLLGARFTPAAIAGTALLWLSKVIDNNEIAPHAIDGHRHSTQHPAHPS